MRAVMVMFDTLNRRFLPAYGGTEDLPNFARLEAHAVTFDRCYAGSMPCMPARREMHTGRPNFLHRSWGPLEPFDDSVPAMLGAAGVYTHLVTDHKHYWGDGGATYHGRFSSFEFFRGQEGDTWKGIVRDPDPVDGSRGGTLWRHDQINRRYTSREDRHPQTLTVDAGLEFIAANRDDDRWFLQLEAFDPHEPFTASERFRSEGADASRDWPLYKRVSDDDAADDLTDAYRALLRQCDHSLGRVLDAFDELELWEDTMLLVCTDHGLLLGEHEWWGKMVQPWYEENIHIPLFVWDPRHRAAGQRFEGLVQTIDLGPTLLEFFGLPSTADMRGRPLGPMLAENAPAHDTALFGNHGGHVNITDGRYVYMRSSISPENQPLFEYTLMPTRLQGAFSPVELARAELVAPLPFTQGSPVLRIPTTSTGSPWVFGTLLFDLETDPGQLTPLEDDEVELRMIELLVAAMRDGAAPTEQYARLGLPERGAATSDHLAIARQRPQREAGLLAAPRATAFEPDDPVVAVSVRALLDDPRTERLLLSAMPFLANPFIGYLAEPLSPVTAAALGPAIGQSEMAELNRAIIAARSSTSRVTPG